jgi:plasmid maintenance system antidote protein VapI
MAVRLCLAFGTAAENWLNHQLQYDLWQVQKQRKSLRVVKFAA